MRAQRNIDRFVKAVLSEFKKAERTTAFEAFVDAFLAQSVREDLEQYSTGELAACVRGAFSFFKSRTPGRPKTRVFNPQEKRDGWSGDVTVIEIINDDMPFLVDSVLSLLNESTHGMRLVLHPVITVHRKPNGALNELAKDPLAPAPGYSRESFIHIHIAPLHDRKLREEVEQRIATTLKDVRIAVLDWRPMLDRLDEAVTAYQNNPPPVAVDELAESVQFLQWLLDNHFTFLGMREYRFDGGAASGELRAVPKSGLGILRDPSVQVLRRGKELVSITPEVREFLMQPAPLIITKANVRARVHRRVHMDYIGIKQFDKQGKLTGELRVVGLFTSVAYTRSARFIPMLRRKIANVVDRSGLNPEGHSGKALVNILEQYPRDELIQIDEETLLDTALGILRLEERPRTRLFVRKDKFDRFVSALVFIPRDRFNTAVRERVGAALADAYEGYVSAFYPAFPEGSLVRVHFIIGRREGETPSPDLTKLEDEIVEIVKTWDDRLAEAIATTADASRIGVTVTRYMNAFSPAYQESFEPHQALADIGHMDRLDGSSDLEIDFYKRIDDDDNAVRLKLYHLGEPIPLSDRLPILENMGLRAIDERSFSAEVGEAGKENTVWIHEVALQDVSGEAIDLARTKAHLKACFLAVWGQRAENDGYNMLVLREQLDWRDVSMLRAYGKYLQQAGIPFSASYLAETVCKHSGIARKLIDLFHDRFATERPKSSKPGGKAQRILRDIDDALQSVPSLAEDRILRRFSNAIMSTLRTNFYQSGEDGGHRPALAFKLASGQVEELPEPRPYAEIFVYAPDVEGVHLRGGKIARGGLRWSDRPEDFRTEVLGLAKAQQVKNAVIVPVGAKGGFVPKNLQQMTTREDIQAEGVRCYKVFISSLLDVTDNLSGDDVVPPPDVVRHDGPDPYLVVAADKGTATFSDIANGISEDRGHWLGDAFASGGSAGYDHKKMGITARGGWEAVKRHFREMNIDIQTTPFTVIGCGDMSGDVFGNGMLLSMQIKLLAAFDHRDIFIDPDPDPAKSWEERDRLFTRPRTSWQDYKASLISKGGGVFSRSLKAIELSDEIRALTGLTDKTAAPLDLIRAILRMQADLLWFGGIGTYIRASTETDEQVGDRANDPVRITADELNVKVIGEGANLGLTQRARIEFAKGGGRVNTDAIDNSAGVNSSDVEVNIKIALGAAEQAGLIDRTARNKLLVQMTAEVADLCLRNNYLQTLCLTLARDAGMAETGFNLRLMRTLERRGLLNRAVEDLPDDLEMAEREQNREPLTRPELSVLMAYAKITAFDELLNSNVPDDPYLARELFRYFPEKLQKRYADQIAGHRLRREIIATVLSNSVINRGGPSFITRLADETALDAPTVVSAFAIARDSFDFANRYGQVDALDNAIDSAVQIDLYRTLQEVLRHQTVWFLRNVMPVTDLGAVVEHYRDGVEALDKALDTVLPAAAKQDMAAQAKRLEEAGVPKSVAAMASRLRHLSRAPDIVLVASQNDWKVPTVAKVFYGLGAELGIDRIAELTAAVSAQDYYERVAVNRTLDGVLATQRMLTSEILAQGGKAHTRAWDNWVDKHEAAVTRTRGVVDEIVAGDISLAKLTVAGSTLSELLAR